MNNVNLWWRGVILRCFVCNEIRSDPDSRMCEQCKKEGRE